MGENLLRALGIMLLVACTINLSACVPTVQAADLMAGIAGKEVAGKERDAKFVGSIADFSLLLFQESVAAQKNSLVSPLSVLLALAMTANGAGGETLAEMEAVLGNDIPLSVLNEYLYTFAHSLGSEKKAKLSIANSIWLRDDERLVVENDFLQTNADYYQAATYKSPFDGQTLKDINNWVNKHTKGMIDSILDQIDPDSVMYLINAVAFIADWEKAYAKADVWQGDFTTAAGAVLRADFMRSAEALYIEDDQVTGFIKPYANNNYSFVALLPKPGLAINDYIAGLSGARFLETLEAATNTTVNASLPKFSYDYTIKLNDALANMGMPQAFLPDADFSRLGRSAVGKFFIGEVLHKTFVEVDEKGTKAAAVTKVDMRCTSAAPSELSVVLDRPFVYAIIENGSSLPIFIGALMEVGE